MARNHSCFLAYLRRGFVRRTNGRRGGAARNRENGIHEVMGSIPISVHFYG